MQKCPIGYTTFFSYKGGGREFCLGQTVGKGDVGKVGKVHKVG